MQCAAYVGLRARRLPGAVAAFVGFGLPAFVLMLVLASVYGRAGRAPAVAAALTGLRALVVALVANAAWGFGRSSLKGPKDVALAAATAMLFFLGVSPFLIVVAAGLAGALLLDVPVPAGGAEARGRTPGWSSLRAPAVLLLIGCALVSLLWLADRRLLSLCLVMMRVDLFAFGGGFAALPLMFREVVGARRWMPAYVFMDGIALGQVTPGPIIITATFVGHQVAGLAGAIVATAGVFLPSLLMVTLAEPWFVRLRGSPLFQRVSRGFLLSFAGLLVSVAAQFAALAPWNVATLAIAACGLATLLAGVDVLWVVLAGAVASALFAT
jgi:chromate transporter